MGERRGSGELPEDNSSSTDRSTSSGVTTSLPLLGWARGNGRGGSGHCPARPASNWVLTVDSPVHVVWPLA